MNMYQVHTMKQKSSDKIIISLWLNFQHVVIKVGLGYFWIFFRTNLNAHFNMNMYVTLCDIHVHIEVCIKVCSKKYPKPYAVNDVFR